jgi:hypothetical protein
MANISSLTVGLAAGLVLMAAAGLVLFTTPPSWHIVGTGYVIEIQPLGLGTYAIVFSDGRQVICEGLPDSRDGLVDPSQTVAVKRRILPMIGMSEEGCHIEALSPGDTLGGNHVEKTGQ